jgi:hypothetical protein
MSRIEWNLFNEKLPEESRLILYGNHRMIEVLHYHPDDARIKKGKLEYKDITHWSYINPPPCVEEESKWI